MSEYKTDVYTAVPIFVDISYTLIANTTKIYQVDC